VHFGDDRYVGATFGCLDGGSHPGEPSADDDDIVFDQVKTALARA
jgi:hypothetical protein